MLWPMNDKLDQVHSVIQTEKQIYSSPAEEMQLLDHVASVNKPHRDRVHLATKLLTSHCNSLEPVKRYVEQERLSSEIANGVENPSDLPP